VVLHDRSGGSAQGLVQSFEVADFNGEELAGEWRLVVVDLASQDSGSLTSWSLSAIVAE
jgi:subtilisin-like proprotein convertase family protein